MPIINIPVPSLTNGVSQQAASVRSETQLSAQDNAWPSLVDGLIKRPPLEHVAKLRATVVTDAFVHDINRDLAERYIVLLMDGDLEVYDLIAGTLVTLTTPDGTTYLDCTTPSEELTAVTVADYTFIVNKTKVVTLDSMTTTATVTITIASPGVVTHTAHGFSAGSEIVFTTTGALPTGLTAGVTYYILAPTADTYTVAATRGGAAINTSGTQSGVHTATNTVGKYLTATVQAFTGLPGSPAFGDIYKITGNATNPFDNYYVSWNGSVWVETIKPGLQNSYTASTMPHILVRNSDGTFTFSKATWDARLVSDEESAPAGAFVGRTISEVLFHRNRLGLAADEGVVFSRAASFFNFFRSTATQVLDTDPVHTAVSHSKVSLIRHAVAFDKQTLMFADQTQFALTAGEALTPTTSSIGVTTEFECSVKCRPVPAGSSLYFSAERGGGACIREYFVEKDTLQNDAADITAHCPTYVPYDVFKLAASTPQDCLFALTRSEPNVLYVYKFYWQATDKLQSAWGKWTLASTDTLLGATAIGSVAYFVIQRTDGVFLEKCNLQQGLTDADVGLRVHLDRRLYLTGVYNAGTDVTTWTMPYALALDANMQVVLGGDFTNQRGSLVTFTRPSTTTVAAVGDFSAGEAYIGLKYTMRVRLSEPFLRDKDGGPILDGRLQLKRLLVRYANSGSFRIEVTPQARDTSTYSWNGKRLGDSSFIIGVPSVASGTFKAPILSRSDRVTVELVNDSFLPSAFQSAEWVAESTPKSKRE